MKKIYFGISFLFFSCITMHATVHVINTEDFEFDPSSLNVLVGDTVRWMWDNSAGSHTTTSTSIPPGALPWDSPVDASNQNFSYVVTTAGSYNYKCTFHTAMGMVGSFNAGGSTALNNFSSGSFILDNNVITGAIHITMNLTTPDLIQVSLYDMKGNIIKDIGHATHEAGIHSETYSVNGLATGMYLLQVQGSSDGIIKKIIIK